MLGNDPKGDETQLQYYNIKQFNQISWVQYFSNTMAGALKFHDELELMNMSVYVEKRFFHRLGVKHYEH